MPKFLCIEDGEEFTIEAKDMTQAREYASVYNGEVIREMTEETGPRPIHTIAKDIHDDWKTIGNGVSPHAQPYLRAMLTMKSPDDKYGHDDGRGIIQRFLSNAQHYRGETARKLKAELKSQL